MSRSYAQAEGNWQPRGQVGKPSRSLTLGATYIYLHGGAVAKWYSPSLQRRFLVSADLTGNPIEGSKELFAIRCLSYRELNGPLKANIFTVNFHTSDFFFTSSYIPRTKTGIIAYI
jgi:hypothetical protein